MKKSIIAVLLTVLFLFMSGVVYAQDSSSSSETVLTTDGESGSSSSTALSNLTAEELTKLQTTVSCQAHVQSNGWMPTVTSGNISGTTGEAKRLEAFALALGDTSEGSIEYRAHVQNVGWQDWVSDNAQAGTTGEALGVQAISVRLTGALSEKYDIYYRVHVANIGWLDWTANGTDAGTVGIGRNIEAYEIKIVNKGSEAPGETTLSFADSTELSSKASLSVAAQVQNIGWSDAVGAGQTVGTVGKGLQLETLRVSSSLAWLGSDSGIETSVHTANLGWLPSVSEGTEAGTVGEGLAIQAVKFSLTGQAASFYDVYYRAHVRNVGWMDWAKNGEIAGTTGLGLRTEAIEIVITPKNASAPGSTHRPGVTREGLQQMANVEYTAYVENSGWLSQVSNGTNAGYAASGCGIEGLSVKIPNWSEDSAIAYRPYIENIGWYNYADSGNTAGVPGTNQQFEAVVAEITGEASKYYDLYYQAYSEDYGWLGWAKNGGWCGTTNGNRKLEALNFKLVVKGDPAPGSTDNPYVKAEPKPTGYTAATIPNFDLICAVVQHEGGASYESALAVMSCVMNRCDSGAWGGTDPVSVLTAPGQFSSYLDGYYTQFLGRTSTEVQRAVIDCMNGKRSHPYTSFRSYPTWGSTNIGGNWYF